MVFWKVPIILTSCFLFLFKKEAVIESLKTKSTLNDSTWYILSLAISFSRMGQDRDFFFPPSKCLICSSFERSIWGRCYQNLSAGRSREHSRCSSITSCRQTIKYSTDSFVDTYLGILNTSHKIILLINKRVYFQSSIRLETLNFSIIIFRWLYQNILLSLFYAVMCCAQRQAR